MNRLIIISISVFLLLLLSGFKNEKSIKDDKINKIAGLPNYTIANANNMAIWVHSNGRTGSTPQWTSGIIFPRRTAGVMYAEGIVWGGNVTDGQTPGLRVGGSAYSSNLAQGAILGVRTGQYENSSSADVRIWRVDRNWENIDLLDELNERNYNLTEFDIRNQYETDWDEWPVSKGAPFEDINGNNVYDPLIDIPGIPGADQTLWYVANDIAGTANYGSPSIGLEMQTTIWSYERPEGDPFHDISFKRVVLIYKGTSLSMPSAFIEDMYISQWFDADIGTFTDDFAGCDSSLNLGYGYNSSKNDNGFNEFNLFPPAFGYCLVQGPIIPSEEDTAIFNFQPKPGFRNLNMSSFFYFGPGSVDQDPSTDYEGALEWYNLMQGLRPQLGTPWQNPVSGNSTHFPLSGNPLTEEGWIDGMVLSPGDRRMGITSGPFDLAIGDTQEVVISIIGDNSSDRGLAYLRNVDGVRRKARNIDDISINNLAVDIKTNTLVALNQEIQLQAFHLLYDPSLEISGNSWEIIAAPQGSNAILSSSIGEVISFTPDSSGTYIIQVTATSEQGNSAFATVEIIATDNQAANVDFSIVPQTIILGDSVYANGSATNDPEGDSLSFSYDISYPVAGQGGGYVFQTPGEDETKSFFKPTATGEYSLKLTAFDGIFESDTSKTFLVMPLEQNLTTAYSFIDTSWYRTGGYFFYEDKLLVGIEPLDIVRIYQLGEDNISFYKDINIPNALRVYKIENDKLYIGTKGELSGFWGPGPLSIYQIENDWEVSPIIENYLPANHDIFEISFTDSLTIIRDRTNIYIVDLSSNPASPQIMFQRSYEPAGSFHPDIAGQYLYVGVTYPERVIEILGKDSLNYISEFEITGSWRNLDTYGQYLFVGFNDSLQIYNIQNPLSPVKLITIQIPDIFVYDWPNYLRYSAELVGENILAVETNIGITFFDIRNASQPVILGAWYGGRNVDFHDHGNNYYIFGFDLIGSIIKDVYYGINKVTFDFVTSTTLNDNAILAGAIKLYQNYPNPFNPETKIEFDLPQAEKVLLEVFNILGQRVAVLIDGKIHAGTHKFSFSGDGLASGIYFYKLRTKSYTKTMKMLLLK